MWRTRHRPSLGGCMCMLVVVVSVGQTVVKVVQGVYVRVSLFLTRRVVIR